MIGVSLFAADTDREAQRLATSAQLMFLNLIRGHPGELPPPVESMEGRWSPAERAAVEERMRYAAIGSPETVRRRLEEFRDETGADEFIATAQIFDHAARLHSFEIGAEIFRTLAS
jgi:alkanesulfonate monooxygenase SsuD/methylene tetrahydromethanopterin reductase-like flavin-dependent oxidoreductase (luciferase family)